MGDLASHFCYSLCDSTKYVILYSHVINFLEREQRESTMADRIYGGVREGTAFSHVFKVAARFTKAVVGLFRGVSVVPWRCGAQRV